MPHFTGVVEKINHELSKQALNDQNFAKEDSLHGGEKMRIMRDIVFAIGDEEDEDGDTDNDEQEAEHNEAEPKETGDNDTLF